MFTNEHLYSIALRNCNLIGDMHFYKLVKYLGSAENTWNKAKKEFKNLSGIGSKIIADIGNPEHLKFAEKELQFCEKHSISVLLRHHKQLPYLLDECDDAPAILFSKGKFPEKYHPISIVGTRNMTSYGKDFISDFIREIEKDKIVTVSGLALGVDKEVHELSIVHQLPTIAVLAHGFHTLYPSKNKKLSEKILEDNGVLITEFCTNKKPDRENFIQRNRIIAGISPATIVVETGFSGGSVSTATFANNYNREVYALPGKITDKHSQGCNMLIQQNKANTISTVKSLIDALDIKKTDGKIEELFPISETTILLSPELQSILEIIKEKPNISLDELAEKIETPAHQILPKILELELQGKIRTLSGRQFLAL